MWHDVGHSFLWVWVWVSSCQIRLSFWARNPHKGLAREISRETGKRQGKARSQGERREESREQNMAVRRREQWTEVEEADGQGKATATTFGPRAGLADAREWVHVPGGYVGISLEYTIAIAHRYTESYAKVSQTSLFLCLELTQVLDCLSFFIFQPLSCVCCALCAGKEMWNTTGRRWEKPLEDRMARSGLGGWDSGGRSTGVLSHLNATHLEDMLYRS